MIAYLLQPIRDCTSHRLSIIYLTFTVGVLMAESLEIKDLASDQSALYYTTKDSLYVYEARNLFAQSIVVRF